MYRVKTTTRAEKEFLSPFVYTGKQIHRLIRSLKRWHQNEETGLPSFEIIEVDRWPIRAVFKDDWNLVSIERRLPRVERSWEIHYD